MKEGWKYKKIGQVCEILNGFAFKSDEYEEKGVRVMRITNVQKGTVVDDDPKFFPLARVNEISRYLLREGDVLMSLTGNVGRVGIIEEKFLPAALNQRVACLRLKDKEVDKKYLFHILNSDAFENDCIFNAAGIAQKNMSTKWLEQYDIPVPPLKTQQHIVSELDLLQSIIDKQKAQLKELDNLAQAVFYDMFGDPVENNKKWDKKRIDEIGEIVSGSTPSTTDESNWNGDVNWITPAEMGVQLYYGETQRKITQKAAKSLTLMPVGTVLLSSRAPIGKLAISTVPMCCNQGFKNIICGKSINNIFMYYYLMLTMDNVIALGRGATFKEVSKQGISAYNVIVPPLHLQQTFAAKIESIEKQKTTIVKSIEETQKLFDYTMDKYFG